MVCASHCFLTRNPGVMGRTTRILALLGVHKAFINTLLWYHHRFNIYKKKSLQGMGQGHYLRVWLGIAYVGILISTSSILMSGLTKP